LIIFTIIYVRYMAVYILAWTYLHRGYVLIQDGSVRDCLGLQKLVQIIEIGLMVQIK
jgi:hypothetical protein